MAETQKRNMPLPSKATDYYMHPDALTLSLNAEGAANLLYASVYTNASVMAFRQDVIGYDAYRLNYRTWNITAFNTHFTDNQKRYCHLSIDRTGDTCMVIYSDVRYDLLGRPITDDGTRFVDDYGLPITPTKEVAPDEDDLLDADWEKEPTYEYADEQVPDEDTAHYYLFYGLIGPVSGNERRWLITPNTGMLDTDQYRNEEAKGDWAKMFRYDAVLNRISQLLPISVSKILNLVLGKRQKKITDVLVSEDTLPVNDEEDENYVNDDELLPSVGFVRENMLSSKEEDEAEEVITFLKGIISKDLVKSDNFEPGLLGAGWQIDQSGKGEMDSLSLRKFLEVPELRYNRVSVHTGVDWQTFGGGIIEEVTVLTETTGMVKLKLEDGEYGAVAVEDKCQGIFHNTDVSQNSTETVDEHNGNFEFMGFQTVYFRVVAICDAEGDVTKPSSRNQYFLYELRPSGDDWQGFSAGKNFHPQPAMHFASYANAENSDRQACIYSTTNYAVYLKGMTDWTYDGNNISLIVGTLNGFSIPAIRKNEDGEDEEYMKALTGIGIATGNVYMWGAVDQFDRQPYIITQQIRVMATDDDVETVLGRIEVDAQGNPTKNHWLNYYAWSDGTTTITPTADAPNLYQYWTYSYDNDTVKYSQPYLLSALQERNVRYYLEPSVRSVVIDSTGAYSEDTVTCRQMCQVGKGAPVETDDLLLSYSVDGGEEQTYTSLVLAEVKPTSSIKFYLRDAEGVIYDTTTVAVLTDGMSAARIYFAKEIIPLECSRAGWGDNLTEEADGYFFLSKDQDLRNTFYVMQGTERMEVIDGSVIVTFDPVQTTTGDDATLTDLACGTDYVYFRLLRDRFRTDRNTHVTVTLRYADGSTNGAEVTGAFVITYNRAGQDGNDALSGKGSTLFPVRWDTVVNDESFTFESGQLGEKFSHMVLYQGLWYECIASVSIRLLLATGLTPDTDTEHFKKANNFEAVATRLLLAELAYIENLGVRFVKTLTGEGNISCTIDGDTGKLVARGAEIYGHLEAETGKIGGFLLDELILKNANYLAGIQIDSENKAQTVHIGKAAQYDNADLAISSTCSVSASSSVQGKTNRELSATLQTDLDMRNNTSYNTVLALNAQNGTYNNAFVGRGNGFLDGVICGYRAATVTLPSQYCRGLLFLEEGTTAIIKGQADAGKTDFTLPSLENVRRTIGYTGAASFAIPYTVINLCEKSAREIRILNTTTPNGAAPYIIDADRNQVKEIRLGAGDVFRCILVYTGASYYAVQDSYPNFSMKS